MSFEQPQWVEFRKNVQFLKEDMLQGKIFRWSLEQYEEACLVRELECQKMLILHFDVYKILFCPILFHFSPV